jgi:hypothetical protein
MLPFNFPSFTVSLVPAAEAQEGKAANKVLLPAIAAEPVTKFLMTVLLFCFSGM